MVHAHFVVGSAQAMYEQQQVDSAVTWFFYGIMTSIVLASLVSSACQRDRASLYFALVVFLFAVTRLIIDGYAFMLWPHYIPWQQLAIFPMSVLTDFCLIIFCREYLRLPDDYPRLSSTILDYPRLANALALLAFLWLLYLLALLLMPERLAQASPIYWMITFSKVCIFFIALFCFYQGQKAAVFLILALLAQRSATYLIIFIGIDDIAGLAANHLERLLILLALALYIGGFILRAQESPPPVSNPPRHRVF